MNKPINFIITILILVCSNQILASTYTVEQPTAESLLATIDKIKKIRENGNLSPANIILKGGTYYLSETLIINPDIVGGGLTVRSQNPDDPAIISGGQKVSNWKIEEDGSWSAILKKPIAEQFFSEESLLIKAREPNRNDVWRIEKAGPDRRTTFTWQANTLPVIKDVLNTRIVFFHDWSISIVDVQSLDSKTRTLRTQHPLGASASHYAIDNFEKQPRFFLEGARDFLDQNGEWCFNKSDQKLSYLPKKGENFESQNFTIPRLGKILKITGTEDRQVMNLNFININFKHADYSPKGNRYAAGQATGHEDGGYKVSINRKFVPSSIEVEYASNINFLECAFKQSSTGGLWINRCVKQAKVYKCEFSELGGNGLMVGCNRLGKRSDDQPFSSEVLVEHSIFEDCGTRYYGAVGIWIGVAQDVVLRKNTLRQLPYSGISLGWYWDDHPSYIKRNIVEDNHIHDVMQLLSDGAGIYTLGRQEGSVIRKNHIHNIPVNMGKAQSNGIFMDEGSSDFLVEGNNIYNIAGSPVRFNKASNNIVRNNRLISANESISQIAISSNTPKEKIEIYNNTEK